MSHFRLVELINNALFRVDAASEKPYKSEERIKTLREARRMIVHAVFNGLIVSYLCSFLEFLCWVCLLVPLLISRSVRVLIRYRSCDLVAQSFL